MVIADIYLLMRDTSNKESKSLVKAILVTGLLAGFLDGSAAAISYVIIKGGNPANVYLYVASSVLGQEAFNHGLAIAFLGLLLHFIIAMIFTTLFFILYPKIKVIGSHPVIAGLIYGAVVWLIMNLIVLPLTRVNQPPFELYSVLRNVIILMFMIGLPVSLMANRYYNSK